MNPIYTIIGLIIFIILVVGSSYSSGSFDNSESDISASWDSIPGSGLGARSQELQGSLTDGINYSEDVSNGSSYKR